MTCTWSTKMSFLSSIGRFVVIVVTCADRMPCLICRAWTNFTESIPQQCSSRFRLNLAKKSLWEASLVSQRLQSTMMKKAKMICRYRSPSSSTCCIFSLQTTHFCKSRSLQPNTSMRLFWWARMTKTQRNYETLSTDCYLRTVQRSWQPSFRT